jgi:hypothetical protein
MKKLIQKLKIKKEFTISRFLILSIGFLILFGINSGYPQAIRWLHVGELQAPINEIGAEYENEIPTGNTNFFSWPAQYSLDQNITRMKGLWIGCKNFNDPVEGRLKSVKVIQSGPRDFSDRPNQIFPVELKLIGKEPSPIVIVDNIEASENITYDLVDEYDPNLPADRMVLVRFNTSIGISVTKKTYSFANSEHGNYFIYDYVFKNTGIYNRQGDVLEQTLQDVWFYYMYRYGFAGVTSLAFGSTWGEFSTQWGVNTVNHSFGEDPSNPEFRDYDGNPLRGFFSWPGPVESTVRPSYAEDWGTPKMDEPDGGTLGTAKYAGCVTLHADVSSQNQNDDPLQPKTTWFIASDGNHVDQNVSQYNESDMQIIYDIMSEGHPTTKHDVLVGDGYAFDYGDPARQNGGGTSQGQGYGPYTLAYGDSIRIVFAEGVSGLSWEKGREIGNNWLQWRNNTGQPQLIMPDGSTTTDYNLYKRRWFETGKDSILKTFRNAVQNYNSGYIQSPAPPGSFTVTSGGDRIKLEWEAAPGSEGYVVYRSRGNVLDYRTVYSKIFETNDPGVTGFDDVTAVRGFDYYYYIQSKSGGALSSFAWTVTNTPATLQRPAGDFLSEIRVVPNPYDVRGRFLQFGDQSLYDRIAFYGLPPVCKLKIFTERGDMIWEKDHVIGTGDELWDSKTTYGQIVASGIYILYVEVTEDTYATEDKFATHDIYDDNLNLIYRTGDLMYRTGDLIFRQGESKYRKFVIIR